MENTQPHTSTEPALKPAAAKALSASRGVRTVVTTPADRCRRLVEMIAETTGEAWTFGYIGNVEGDRDDRGWFAFRPHPGRIGTSADRIGGQGTDDLDQLALMLQGALAMARMGR